ncbi:MAG: PDP protein [Campylobacterales bacterium]|nr:PDP protein [Campylobacterales bacterium]
MKWLLLLGLVFGAVQAIETSENLFDCSKIFQERKAELLVELERIDEQRQALEALKIATDDLLTRKEQMVLAREANVTKVLEEISAKEAGIKAMLEKNEALLSEMKSLKTDQIGETFAKMKAASAASILEQMEPDEAIKIMATLKPKTIGQILAKMAPEKASALAAKLGSLPK